MNANVELVAYEESDWLLDTEILYDDGIAYTSQQGTYEHSEEGYQLLLDACINVDEVLGGVNIDILRPRTTLVGPSVIRFSSELDDESRRNRLPDAYLAAADYLLSVYPEQKSIALGILAGVYGLAILIDDLDISFHQYGAQVEEMYEAVTA